jgi:hypothetical protein
MIFLVPLAVLLAVLLVGASLGWLLAKILHPLE